MTKILQDLPRQKLREVIAEREEALWRDPLHCKSLLLDLCCNEYRREINALIIALDEEHVVDSLTNLSSTGLSYELKRSYIAIHMYDESGIADDVALWAVDSWALGLKIITESQLAKLPNQLPGYSRKATIEDGNRITDSSFAGQRGALQLPREQQNEQPIKIVAASDRNPASSKNLGKKPGFSAKTWLIISLLIAVLLIGSETVGILHYVLAGQRGKLSIASQGLKDLQKSTPIIVDSVTLIPDRVYPPAGLPQLSDPLITNKLNWDEGSPCNFANGVYQITLPPENSAICYAHGTNYQNFVYQIQMTFIKMGQRFSAGGIAFRGDDAANASYDIKIFESGEFSFVANGESQTVPEVLAGYPQNGQSVIGFRTQTGQSNTLAIVAINNEFVFYVNNRRIFGPVQDNTSSHGMLGIFASGGQGSNDTQVTFSDVKVWQL